MLLDAQMAKTRLTIDEEQECAFLGLEAGSAAPRLDFDRKFRVFDVQLDQFSLDGVAVMQADVVEDTRPDARVDISGRIGRVVARFATAHRNSGIVDRVGQNNGDDSSVLLRC